MTNDYVPNKGADKLAWALNLQNQTGVAANATAMGWNTGAVTAVVNGSQAVIDSEMSKEAAKAAYKAAVAAADTAENAGLKILRQQIASGKAQTTYTPAVGQALGVVGTGTPFDPAAYVGELKGLKMIGPVQVQVDFGKASGQIDGVKVYMRRGGLTVWTELSFDTVSPYIDTTPLAVAGMPEVREYRVRGVLNDVEIGQPSPAQSITVA